MVVTEELAAFIESPVMIIVGTRNAALVPSIGRAAGARADRSTSTIDLCVSAWQWPQTVADASETASIAVTFSRPSDYVSYQIKGAVMFVRAPSAHESRWSGDYVVRTSAVLGELGVSTWVIEEWLVGRDLVTIRFLAEEAFIQTPGTKAGQPLRVAG
ncbi:hypothetical protein [Devosia sp.]|uniref:hypothetical protein n=1 Tax=Devosia sp. TaxID=1871048 RepID=UPI002FCAE54F